MKIFDLNRIKSMLATRRVIRRTQTPYKAKKPMYCKVCKKVVEG